MTGAGNPMNSLSRLMASVLRMMFQNSGDSKNIRKWSNPTQGLAPKPLNRLYS